MAGKNWTLLVKPFSEWKFAISCFMALLGEQEEINLRLMRRSIFECLSAAPVAGLGSYLRSSYELADATGLSYISPYGGKKAPLRNMRTARLIADQRLLKDGHARIYGFKEDLELKWHWSCYFHAIGWILFTWAMLVAIIAGICKTEGTTWIGLVTCILFPAWSIIVRLLEMRNTYISENNQVTRPDDQDAIVILGRRESCLVLEGKRKTISKWSGQGVAPMSAFAEWTIRLGSLIILLAIFILIPNGTTYDQIAWIILNLLGLANIKMSRWLSSERSLRRLESCPGEETETRTQVWGFLLRLFDTTRFEDTRDINSRWVDHLDIPKTEIWRVWKYRVVQDRLTDPKAIYNQIAEELKTK